MSAFATWSPGQWATFGLGVAIILAGLLTILFGPRSARRKAIKDGRVDADGDPYYEDDYSSPQAVVRGGLIAVGIGAACTLWRLSAGGVL